MHDKNIFKTILKCITRAIFNMVHHDGVEHAGYMAFISLLSLFPFLVFLTAFAGFLGQSSIGEHFLQYLLTSLPHNISSTLNPRITEIVSGPPQGLMTLAIVGAIWTASSAVEGLRTILNRVYRVGTPPRYILRRMLSIAQFLILVAIIIATTFLLLLLPIILQKLPYWHFIRNYVVDISGLGAIIKPIYGYIRYILVSVTLFTVVSVLYYIIPNTRLKWFDVFPGAFLVIIAWFVAGSVFSLYFNYFNQVGIIYGSLQGVIISLLFFYIINMIFIVGAEFNYLFSKEIKKI